MSRPLHSNRYPPFFLVPARLLLDRAYTSVALPDRAYTSVALPVMLIDIYIESCASPLRLPR